MGNLKKYLYLYITLILLLGSFGIGFFVGQGHKIEVKATEKGWQIFNKLSGGAKAEQPKDVDLSLFWQVWNDLAEKFNNGSLDRQKMVYGAIEGMVKSLGDPYTVFMTPSEAKDFDLEMQGKFEGIGAEIGMRNNRLTIIAPLADSPAAKAGLKAKDLISNINDVDAMDMSLIEAISKIRGEKGTTVKLKIFREGVNDPLEINIVRDEIIVKSVKWNIREDKIAVIEISRFGDDTRSNFEAAVADILLKSPKGLVIDLRNNPGGYLETAIDLASEFIPKKELVAIEEQAGGKQHKFFSSGPTRLAGIPTVVLVNEGSASASEILGGALQDYGIAKLVGKKTFGKGSVQEIDEFTDGSKIRITIAKWLTPKGRYINEKGIEPDVDVDLTAQDINSDNDPQMAKAIEILTK